MSQEENGYHVEDEGTEQEMFSCNTCDYRNKKSSVVKSHITRQHVKKQPEKEKATTNDDDLTEADLAALEEWNRPRDQDANLVEEVEEVATTGGEEREVIDVTTGEEGNLVQAVERIKKLEEDLSAKEEVMKSMEIELATAKDLANIAMATKESMETENAENKAETKKYKLISKNLMDDLNKMRGGGKDPDMERKLKLANDDLKTKSKTVDALEKCKKELSKKLEDEVVARAKAESDCAKFSKMVDILTDKTTSTDKNKAQSKALCRDVNKPGGCPRAGGCKFNHPALAKENKLIDCIHWKNGKCRYAEVNCKYKHDPDKKDSNSKRKRSEGEQSKDASNQQDFMLSLVRALTQGSAREARLGREEESSRGMEGQRSTRARMGSPMESSRGMEDQQRNRRSYASAASYRHRTESQSSNEAVYRPLSPARGMEGQDVEKIVEQIRGLARPPKSATQQDSLQEGLQLLLQMAQQTGRK